MQLNKFPEISQILKKEKLIFISILIISLVVFLIHYKIVGNGIWGDARYYYSYLHSAVIDQDFDFTNEARYFSYPMQISSTGKVINKFSIGPAIFWLPFYLFAYFISFILRLNLNGYSHIYQIFAGIGSVIYANFGLYFCYQVLKKYFSQYLSIISIISIFFTTNLFFYSSIDPINSHSISFFISSLILFFTQKYIESKKENIISIIGVFLGLLTLIRNQDIIFAILPLIFIFNTNKKLIDKIISFAVPLFITILPQFYIWDYFFGQFKSPYLILGEKFDYLKPQIFNVLFSSNSGLLYYSPILLLSIIGILFLFKKHKEFSISFSTIFLLQLYIVSAWHSWWGGASYGNRMFISLMPIFIFSLAQFLKTYQSKRKYFIPIFIILSILNAVQIIKVLLLT